MTTRTPLFRRIAVLLAVAQVAAVAWSAGQAHARCTEAQAEQVRHAALAPAPDGHGHAHEDGEDGERLPGHVHGKNVIDHSHEAPSVVHGFGVAAPVPYRSWTPGRQASAPAHPPDPFDRPPKRA